MENELKNPVNDNTIVFETRDDQVRYHLLPNMVGAELGVFKGEFSEVLLSTNPSKLYLVDPFVGIHSSGDRDGRNMQTMDLNDSYNNLVNKYGHYDRVAIHRGTSMSFLNQMNDNSLDFVYIDAEHTYDAVKSEMNLSFRKIKVGGYIMGHDYTWSQDCTWRFDGVVAAVNEFCKETNHQLSSITKCGCPSFCIKVNK